MGRKKGCIPWNKGLKNHLSEEQLENIRNGARNRSPDSEETRKKKGLFWKDRKHTEETKEKCRLSAKTGDSHYLWKGGVKKSGLCSFDLAIKLIGYAEEIRRCPFNNFIAEVKCTYCGKWFSPKSYQVRNRYQALIGNYGKNSELRLYCSDDCKHECPIYGQKSYPKGYKITTSREVQPELRQLVFLRDNYTCQKCGSLESLHCHHIDPVKLNPIESADVDNCITYCKDCHKWVHMCIPGCGYAELANCIKSVINL